MSKKQKIPLINQPEEFIIRSGDFELLPPNQGLPIILVQPSQSFNQTTWIRQFINNEPIYQTINPASGVYTMLAGTSINWKVSAVDPTTNENLVYVWKRDGVVLQEFNSLNNNAGTDVITFNSRECLPDISGEYICEISNAFGTVETNPISIQVINSVNNPFFYKNLIINGNGDGGLNEWTANVDIITKPFATDSIRANRNFGSYYNLEFPVEIFQNDSSIYPNSSRQQDFSFSQAGHFSLFYPIWYKAKTNNPELLNVQNDSVTMDSVGLASWEAWIAQGFPSQIVLNEDAVASGQYAGFFPGLYWMDRYNRNLEGNGIGLFDESVNNIMTYFTRDKIKFTKFGGSQTTQMSQTIDLTEYADLINGNAYGINHVSSQFFSYIGAGITRYQIKATAENGTEAIYNWFIQGSEDFVYHVVKGNPFGIKLKPNTPIEIIPIVDDTTNVTIDYINSFGEIIQTDVIQGPDEQDVFAVKEKVYLPLSLYPVVQFFAGNFLNLREEADTLFGWPTINFKSLIYRYYGNYENYVNSNVFTTGYIPESRVVEYKDALNLYLIKIDLSVNNDTFNGVRESLSVNDILSYTNPSNTYFWKDIVDKDFVYNTLVESFQPTRVSASFSQGAAITSTINLDESLPITFVNTSLVNGTLRRSDIGYEVTDEMITSLLNRSNSSNPITVFGQKYTDLNAIKAVKLSNGPSEDIFLAKDRNARFLQKKYNFKKYNATVPAGGSSAGEFIQEPLNKDRAIIDYGASAMFGVGKTTIIPKNTTSVKITVNFTHTSNVPLDAQPEFKGWTNQEIYANLFGEYPLNSERVIEYGNPRCGITKMKFILMPNESGVSTNHITYYIPPPNSTVLGLQKNKLFEDNNDTSEPGDFIYTLVQPQNLPTPPVIETNPLFNQDQLNSLQNNNYTVTSIEDKIIMIAPTSSRA